MLKDDLNKKCLDVYIPDTNFKRNFAEYRKEKVEIFVSTLLKTFAKALISIKYAEKASRLISLSDCQDASKVLNAYITIQHIDNEK